MMIQTLAFYSSIIFYMYFRWYTNDMVSTDYAFQSCVLFGLLALLNRR